MKDKLVTIDRTESRSPKDRGDHYKISRDTSWPKWKKDAYNEMFAISPHVKPI